MRRVECADDRELVRRIGRAACAAWGVDSEELGAFPKDRPAAEARQAAMYVGVALTEMTLAEVAEALAGLPAGEGRELRDGARERIADDPFFLEKVRGLISAMGTFRRSPAAAARAF